MVKYMMRWMILLGCVAFGEMEPLSVGSAVPSLTLTTAEGEPFNLNEAIAEKPTVLIFYRGGWCPYCNQHLMELQGVESQLIDLGVQIFAISPDRPEELLKAMDGDDVNYTRLSDSLMKASNAFGLTFKVDEATREKYRGYGIDLERSSGQSHFQLPVPAVFIIGADGVVLFSHADPDYKVRLSAEKVLEAAQSAMTSSKKKPCCGMPPAPKLPSN